MKNKYHFDFSYDVIKINVGRLTNQLWKLIPMRENGEDWYKQLTNVLIEITGLNEIFLSDSHFLQLLSKLEGLKQLELQFEDYRRTIFESISLLQGFLKNYE